MASFTNQLSFFFLLVLFLSPQIQAREAKLFSLFTHFKTKNNVKEHHHKAESPSPIIAPTKTSIAEPASAPEFGLTIPTGPAPEPEFLDNGEGYGLYGRDSSDKYSQTEIPTSANTPTFENELLNEDFNDNKSYKTGYPQTNFHSKEYTKNYNSEEQEEEKEEEEYKNNNDNNEVYTKNYNTEEYNNKNNKNEVYTKHYNTEESNNKNNNNEVYTKNYNTFENELLNEDFNDNKSYKTGYPQTNFHSKEYTKNYNSEEQEEEEKEEEEYNKNNNDNNELYTKNYNTEEYNNKNNNNEVYTKNYNTKEYYNNNNNEVYTKNINTEEDNNNNYNNGYNKNYDDNYNNNSYGDGYKGKREGMSDTRFVENGKYYHNVNSENEQNYNLNGYGRGSTGNYGQFQNEFDTMEEYEKQQEAQGYKP